MRPVKSCIYIRFDSDAVNEKFMIGYLRRVRRAFGKRRQTRRELFNVSSFKFVLSRWLVGARFTCMQTLAVPLVVTSSVEANRATSEGKVGF